MSNSPKIVHIRVHQAVNFGGSLATYFTTKPAPGKVQANFELRPEYFSLEVFNKDESVLIPLVNIASMHLDSPLEQKKAKIKEAEEAKNSSVRASEIKRPMRIGKD